ncbi:hypothetical protein KKE45_02415 [Patescibacteria group bacterium]|nr:hypothetical protein [Patescibacteria group bacterium]
MAIDAGPAEEMVAGIINKLFLLKEADLPSELSSEVVTYQIHDAKNPVWIASSKGNQERLVMAEVFGFGQGVAKVTLPKVYTEIFSRAKTLALPGFNESQARRVLSEHEIFGVEANGVIDLIKPKGYFPVFLDIALGLSLGDVFPPMCVEPLDELQRLNVATAGRRGLDGIARYWQSFVTDWQARKGGKELDQKTIEISSDDVLRFLKEISVNLQKDVEASRDGLGAIGVISVLSGTRALEEMLEFTAEHGLRLEEIVSLIKTKAQVSSIGKGNELVTANSKDYDVALGLNGSVVTIVNRINSELVIRSFAGARINGISVIDFFKSSSRTRESIRGSRSIYEAIFNANDVPEELEGFFDQDDQDFYDPGLLDKKI